MINWLGGMLNPVERPLQVAYVDDEGIQHPHHDPIVVTLNIDDCNVHHILVDIGSSVDLLSYDAFVKMKIDPSWLRKSDITLTGYMQVPISIEGAIDLPIIAGTLPK